MSNILHDFSGEAYGEVSALRYDTFASRPSAFAQQIAPKIWSFYQKARIDQDNNRVLDVGCGTGQLATHFLARGARVVGLDRSPHMLKYAVDNNAEYVAKGQARFVEDDASAFHFDEQFGLVVSTFNSLNHLNKLEELERCLACVYRVLAPGGYFLFDFNTRRGLKSTVESNEIFDTDEEIIVRKRLYDGQRVILYASGCFLHQGKWHRYRETIFKIIIDTVEIRRLLLDQGWTSVAYTSDDFLNPIEDPEAGNLAYVVAHKAG